MRELGLFLLTLLRQDPEGVDFFERTIRPLFAERCYGCHSARAPKLKGGLRLDTPEGLRQGGTSGAVFAAGDPDRSLLVRAVRYQDEELRMPPKERLTPAQVADLEAWVRRGAPLPAPAAPAADPRGDHWAFRAPREPALPEVRQKDWVRTPVDRFVLARLEAKGLRPAPAADAGTLLRRLSFDLAGLPPTPEEIDAFLADPAADAYEKAVERLLASPRYGERWGRHWLDVARYADTKGYTFGPSKFPYAYAYRDWVIRAFNEDMPYDRFLMLQIAADRLVAGDDRRDLAALGFLTVGRRFLNNVHDIIDDRIDVVMRGMQALTLGCARCHDHKYDPIPTADYYALYGVFAGAREPEELPLLAPPPETPAYRSYERERRAKQEAADRFLEARGAELLASLTTPEAVAKYLLAAHEMRGLHENEVKPEAKRRKLNGPALARWWWFLRETARTKDPLFAAWHEAPSKQEVAKAYGELLSPREALLRRVLFDPADWLTNLFYPDGGPMRRRPANPVEMLLEAEDRKKLGDLRKQVEDLEHRHPGAPPRAMVLEDDPAPSAARVFVRGNPRNPGREVPSRYLEVLSAAPFARGRLDLARAIASPDNPLTARVMANRVWQGHFGEGIVRTASDFGIRGEPPTHPELLDWLACRLAATRSIKDLHRVIVNSAVYRQRSEGDPETARQDPENLLLGRRTPRRLEIEPLRDALLAVSGEMNLTAGGRGEDASASRRRTVYATIDRQALPGFFRAFDFASPDTHAPQRHLTTVPQQALFLMNSPFVHDRARALARRDAAEPDPERRIRRMYARVYGRPPTARELERGRRFVESPEPPCSEDCDCGSRLAPLGPWDQYAHVLLQSNEFLFID
jgi:hypothetical protein